MEDNTLDNLTRQESLGLPGWKAVDESAAKKLTSLQHDVPRDKIVYLPRKFCKDCVSLYKACPKHTILKRCANCKQTNVTSGHLDTPGISHLYIQAEFEAVDPGWTAIPVKFDENGLPATARTGNYVNTAMWVTVCGVTRLGVGVVEAPLEGARAGRDPFSTLYKELVSDALKNAGLRFGIGANLRGLKPEFAREDNGSSNRAPQAAQRPAAAPAAAHAETAPAPNQTGLDVASELSLIRAFGTLAELSLHYRKLRNNEIIGSEALLANNEVKALLQQRARELQKQQEEAASQEAARERVALEPPPVTKNDQGVTEVEEDDPDDLEPVQLPSTTGRRRRRQAA